jgi:hypothetical protein
VPTGLSTKSGPHTPLQPVGVGNIYTNGVFIVHRVFLVCLTGVGVPGADGAVDEEHAVLLVPRRGPRRHLVPVARRGLGRARGRGHHNQRECGQDKGKESAGAMRDAIKDDGPHGW